MVFELTVVLLVYTIDSQWCFYHSQFVFDVASKCFHLVQISRPLLPIVDIIMTIARDLMCNHDPNMYQTMNGMNQPIHFDVIPFVFVDFASHFQSVQHHSSLMISSKFHCRLTNLKLDRNQVNVIYYVDWYSIVCNLHLCRRFEWSIRNLIGSDNFKVNKSIHHSTFTKIKMEGVLSSNKQAHLYTVITCSYHCMQFGALNIVIP